MLKPGSAGPCTCAEVVEHGHDFQAAREHAVVLAADRGAQPVPAYHPDLVLGVATYAGELFEAAGDLESSTCPSGWAPASAG